MRITAKNTIEDLTINPQEVVSLILKNRQIEKVDEFLNPQAAKLYSLKDFGYSKIFQSVLPLLKKIRQENRPIVVYTDYDADGVTGGAILWETLHLLGFNVMPYVPHRQREGYGFSRQGIEKIKKEYNPALIISVDHGITAVKQIAYAKSLGIDVIVTDHHFKQKELPLQARASIACSSLPTALILGAII